MRLFEIYACFSYIKFCRSVVWRGLVKSNKLCYYCCALQSINPLIAKKMQEDRGRDYMNARRVAKEYEVITKGLNKGAPSVPPQNTPEESKQVCSSYNLIFFFHFLLQIMVTLRSLLCLLRLKSSLKHVDLQINCIWNKFFLMQHLWHCWSKMWVVFVKRLSFGRST